MTRPRPPYAGATSRPMAQRNAAISRAIAATTMGGFLPVAPLEAFAEPIELAQMTFDAKSLALRRDLMKKPSSSAGPAEIGVSWVEVGAPEETAHCGEEFGLEFGQKRGTNSPPSAATVRPVQYARRPVAMAVAMEPTSSGVPTRGVSVSPSAIRCW